MEIENKDIVDQVRIVLGKRYIKDVFFSDDLEAKRQLANCFEPLKDLVAVLQRVNKDLKKSDFDNVKVEDFVKKWAVTWLGEPENNNEVDALQSLYKFMNFNGSDFIRTDNVERANYFIENSVEKFDNLLTSEEHYEALKKTFDVSGEILRKKNQSFLDINKAETCMPEKSVKLKNHKKRDLLDDSMLKATLIITAAISLKGGLMAHLQDLNPQASFTLKELVSPLVPASALGTMVAINHFKKGVKQLKEEEKQYMKEKEGPIINAQNRVLENIKRLNESDEFKKRLNTLRDYLEKNDKTLNDHIYEKERFSIDVNRRS